MTLLIFQFHMSSIIYNLIDELTHRSRGIRDPNQTWRGQNKKNRKKKKKKKTIAFRMVATTWATASGIERYNGEKVKSMRKHRLASTARLRVWKRLNKKEELP